MGFPQTPTRSVCKSVVAMRSRPGALLCSTVSERRYSAAAAPSPRVVARNRVSRLFAPLEIPFGTDVKTLSHQYLIYSGMVKQHAAGIYAFTPIGAKVLAKLSKVVCDELDAIGAQRTVLPTLMTSELWKQTGRWDSAGAELFRLKDRKKHSLLLGPTHEEAVCELTNIQPLPRQKMPLMLYQLDRKFRDEARPRFGLMRGREFWMKDLYTFDRTDEEALATYNLICRVYGRIFTRLGLAYQMADADTGNIGGSKSHEFHILSSVGEDVLLSCANCGSAMNVEKAVGLVSPIAAPSSPTPSSHSTPTAELLRAAAQQLGLSVQGESGAAVSAEGLVQATVFKATYLAAPSETVLTLHRRDRKVNEVKVSRLLKCAELADITAETNVPTVIRGALEKSAPVKTVVDKLVLQGGAEELAATRPDVAVADVDLVVENDFCSSCAPQQPTATGPSRLKARFGIEVGHAFLLGEKYSLPMSVTFVDSDGKRKVTKMGCYGIGISRIMSALLEVQLHAQRERETVANAPAAQLFSTVRWPAVVAPYAVYIGLFTARKSGLSDAEKEQLWATLSGLVHDEIARRGFCPASDIIIDDRIDHKSNALRKTFYNLLGIPALFLFNEESLAALAKRAEAGGALSFASVADLEVETHVRSPEAPWPAKSMLSLEQAVGRVREVTEVPVEYV